MKLFSSKKRIGAIGAVAALSLVGGGVAYGYWTSGGSGTGSAATGTTTDNLVVSASGPSGLVPGGAAQTLAVTVENPNDYSVELQGKTVAIVSGSIKCDTDVVPDTWFTLAHGSVANSTIVAAGDTVSLSGVTFTMNDLPVPQDSCKDDAVSFDLTLS